MISDLTNAKVLYLHRNFSDYLGTGLFHGLRSILGKNCVDVPRFDSVYGPLSKEMKLKCAGHGFSLYGLLEDIPNVVEKRFQWFDHIEEYDLIVLSLVSHWPLYGMLDIMKFIVENCPPEKIAIIDDHDVPNLFPFAWRIIKKDPTVLRYAFYKGRYFKREIIGNGEHLGLTKLPFFIRRFLSVPQRVKPISMSIPKEKISKVVASEKKKLFCSGIIDSELTEYLKIANSNFLGSKNYLFKNEHDYYQDIQKSRFGITTKRAGWDCLRHYEYAANGTVLCFKDLDKKPKSCAPHGLQHNVNCIAYQSPSELMRIINSMSDKKYNELLAESYKWIKNNTTIKRARNFLTECGIG
jgi:hypothetical protein